MRAHVVVLAAAIAGCAPAPSASAPQPQNVGFTNNREAVKGCTMLGVIDSGDRTNGGSVAQSAAERDPYRRLQTEAVRLQANIVLLNEAPTGMSLENKPGGPLIVGEAYRCSRSNPVRI